MGKNMENMVNILLVVLVMVPLASAEVRGDLEDIVKELVVEMRELNAKVEHQDKSFHNLEMKMQEEVTARDASISTLEMEVKAKEDSIQKLAREVSFLRNPPYTYFSAYQSYTSRSGSHTIEYDNLIHSSTNVEGSMDVSTGIFTSGWAGTYTVS